MTVIDLDHERLSFVSGLVAPGRVRVEAWGSLARPSGVDAADGAALGSWVGEQLRSRGISSGISAGRVVVCVPRGNVVMKRLSFPGLGSHEDPDLVEMVRLQMTRQMPMRVEGTAIDFVPLRRPAAEGERGSEGDGGSGDGEAEGAGVSVLACALPGDRVAWCMGVARAAGLRLSELTLRASGAATLMAQAGEGIAAPVMGISIGWSSVEFLVVRDGEIVFVRSADVSLSGEEDAAAYAQRVGVEAKRTWMAYRVSSGSEEPAGVSVVGGGEVAQAVAEECGRALDLPASAIEVPGVVEFAPEGESSRMPDAAEATAQAPLVGLMVARGSDRAVFDFAHPRRAPDRSAALRRRVLLGMLGAIVVVGGGVVLAHLEVSRARAEVRRAEREAREWWGRLAEHQRVDARLRHLERWLDADVDWLGHWTRISQSMPAPPEARLDSLRGSLGEPEVRFQPAGSGSARTYAGSKWDLRLEASFTVSGWLSSRSVGNQFRERLVADPTYRVRSKGTDTESRFDMDLFTDQRAPVVVGAEGATR